MFVSGGRPRVRQLYEYDRTTSEVRRLTSGKRMHPTGTYGPEGRLAYVSVNAKKRRAGISIQVTAPHGARPEVISNGVGTDRIAWEREEGPLVYVKYMKQTGKRKPVPYLVARDPAPGGEERILGPGKDPVMTADGSWVVYSAEEGGPGGAPPGSAQRSGAQSPGKGGARLLGTGGFARWRLRGLRRPRARAARPSLCPAL